MRLILSALVVLATSLASANEPRLKKMALGTFNLDMIEATLSKQNRADIKLDSLDYPIDPLRYVRSAAAFIFLSPSSYYVSKMTINGEHNVECVIEAIENMEAMFMYDCQSQTLDAETLHGRIEYRDAGLPQKADL